MDTCHGIPLENVEDAMPSEEKSKWEEVNGFEVCIRFFEM
jgi:hypothetical protein